MDKLNADQQELARDDVEKQFQEVLAGLSSEEALASFKQEYSKLFGALRESHDNERKLGRKVKELGHELMSNAAKVQQALRLSEEDSATIEDLKKQLEKSYTMVEAANKREEDAQQTIERTQGEVAQLAGLVQRSTDLLGGDMTLEDLMAQRDALVGRVRDLDESTTYERKRADTLAADLQSRGEKQRALKAAHKELERRLAVKEAEEIKDAKRRGVVDADLQRVKEQLGSTSSALEAGKRALADANATKERLSSQLEQARTASAATLAELHALQQVRIKLTDELEDKVKVIDDLSLLKSKAETEAKAAKAAQAEEERQRSKLEHKVASATRELEAAQKEVAAARAEQARLKGDVSTAEKELNRELMHLKDVERAAHRTEKEKAAAEKQAAAEKNYTAVARAEAEAQRAEVRATEAEFARAASEGQKLRSIVSALERDREKLLNQMEGLKEDIEDAHETIRLKDVSLKEAERVEGELQGRLRAVQGQYEAMRAERNSGSKQLMEALDDVGELKRKGKVQGNQIESLKEDVHTKDRALVAEQFEASSLSKQLTAKMNEVEALKRLLEEASENNRRQEVEIGELTTTLRKQDVDALAQKRAFDSVVGERDILSIQLQRRNDEMALLVEKVSIQTVTLRQGEREYGQRVEELAMMRRKVTELKREAALANASKGGTEELKRELIRINNELLAEQGKARALAEELENPLNVHRWRKLEGADPAGFELVQKIHTLQRRLIAKTEEVVEKDLALADKEKALAVATARLAAVPGPELADQLTHAQGLVNERTKQLKALASEINMYQAQVAEYKFELERAAREMVDLKRHAMEARQMGMSGSMSTGGLGAGASRASRAAAGEAAAMGSLASGSGARVGMGVGMGGMDSAGLVALGAGGKAGAAAAAGGAQQKVVMGGGFALHA